MPKTIPFLPFPEFPDSELEAPLRPAGPPDVNARAQALDIHSSFIVEAPAGSGKTGLLIQRYLKLLADDSVTAPEQVLAITFTLKATGELRDRVLAHLEAVHFESAQPKSEHRETTRLGAPGLASETWDLAPHNSIDQPLQLAASTAPSSLHHTSSFQQQTRSLAHAVLARDRKLGWSLLEHPHRLNIRTIDSVCAQIAGALPVLSGSGGHLVPTENAQPLYREAARRTLLLLGADDAVFDVALRDLLLHRDGNLADCETLLADMLALRDQWGSLIWGNLMPLAPAALDDRWLDANVLPRLQQNLEQAICTELTRLIGIFPSNLLDELGDIAGHLGHASPYDPAVPSLFAPCAGLHHAPQALACDRDRWVALAHLLTTKQGEFRKERGVTGKNLGISYNRKHSIHTRLARVLDAVSSHGNLCDELARVSQLPPAQYPADQWAVAKSLFRVLSRALVELQLVFAEGGECDFPELSLLARSALTSDSGPEDLAAALGARLQHLLVDEMQDTSAVQYELIRLLTASWDGHSQTVFLVGDPRQSIYLFRQARVESFLQTMRTRRLGDLPLTCLHLAANFRSQQTMVRQFNENFELVFPNDPAETLPYAPAIATLPPSPHSCGLNWHASPVEIRPNIPNPPTPPQLRQRQSRRDAHAIRRVAECWLAKPLPANRERTVNDRGESVPKPWQIAVLVRSRSHLADIVAAFNDAGKSGNPIPYRAVDITPLNERQEILDLTALTRTLLHPADRVAALAVLRAPWCGLPLAALHILTGSDSEAPDLKELSIVRLIADRAHLLDPDSAQRVARVSSLLEAAASQRARLTTAQLVERTWRSLGGDAWLSRDELVNSRRFFELLDEMESEAGAGRIDPALLAGRLQRLYGEPASIPAGQPFVELLTIHAAKGLEWDVVIVPALERGPGVSRPRLLTWSELDSSGDPHTAPIMLAPIAAKGEAIDALTAWLKEIHKGREAAERKRLFYVASTRAREELHLFAAPDLLASGNTNSRWDSLLKSVLPAAQPHIDAALEARPASHPSKESGALSMEQSYRDMGGLSRRRAISVQNPPEPAILDGIAAAATIHRMPMRNSSPAPPATRESIEPSSALQPNQPIERVPLAFDPAARITACSAGLPYGDTARLSSVPAESALTRPEGGVASRALGNAVHAFLELIAARIASGQLPAAILAELPVWTPRIAAVLRASGLGPGMIDRLTRETRSALANALRDPEGLWLLAPHPGAATEFALAGWIGEQSTSVRVDRTFRAGPEPRLASSEENHLWIVDYKTAAHGPSGLDTFLEAQRAIYAPQLEAYAALLAPVQSIPFSQVRLALYYPAIPRLMWWQPVSM